MFALCTFSIVLLFIRITCAQAQPGGERRLGPCSCSRAQPRLARTSAERRLIHIWKDILLNKNLILLLIEYYEIHFYM